MGGGLRTIILKERGLSKLHYKIFYQHASRNFFELKILWTKGVTVLPGIYQNYFASKIVSSKFLKYLIEKYVLAVYFGRKDILRSQKSCRGTKVAWVNKKLPPLEFHGPHWVQHGWMSTLNNRTAPTVSYTSSSWGKGIYIINFFSGSTSAILGITQISLWAWW